MAKHQEQQIRQALLSNVFWSPMSPVAAVANQFGVTRQAVHKHMRGLVDRGLVKAAGAKRYQRFRLAQTRHASRTFVLEAAFTEDVAWDNFARPLLADLTLSRDESDICHYGLTEMVNNVIDHAKAKRVKITVAQTAASVQLIVEDRGVGIFKKVADALRLTDPQDALFELSTGKFTTDPKHHTGEGLFFASRMFDRFAVLSGHIRFVHQHERGAWQSENLRPTVKGTTILMELIVPTKRRMQEVFSQYSSGPEDYRFAKTHIPLELASFGDESLVSRSSARRVVSRADQFDEVILDFAGVRSIGQAFADEIFRVFRSANPTVRLKPLNANRQVQGMISRALAHASA